MPGTRNLAGWSEAKLLRALTELANSSGELGAGRYLRRFPDFLPNDGFIHPVADTEAKRHAIDAASKVIANTPENRVRHLSNLLPEIWLGTPKGTMILFAFLVIDNLTDAIRVAELLRMETDRGYKTLTGHYSHLPLVDILEHLQPAWSRQGQFKYRGATPLQSALHALWAKSSLAKVCKNPDCPAPFFIAKKTRQQFCGDECAKPSRLEAKMKWWNEHGKRGREGKRRSKKSQGEKR
jgi:hypothetical protein